MSFTGVVDILHAAPSQQLHLLPSSGLPSPGSLFFDTLRAGSWAATIAKRFIYFLIPSQKTGEQTKSRPERRLLFLILFLFVSIYLRLVAISIFLAVL